MALATANFRNTTIGNNSTVQETDLAVLNQTSNNVSILLPSVDNNGNVTFTEQTSSPIAVGTNPVAIAAGDLDTDGIPDLAVVNQGDNSISILMGSTTRTQHLHGRGLAVTYSHDAGRHRDREFYRRQRAQPGGNQQGREHARYLYRAWPGGFLQSPGNCHAHQPFRDYQCDSHYERIAGRGVDRTGDTASQGVVTIIQDSSSFANGATPTQTPYPGAEYIDLGVKVKATPTLHPNRDVTLQLEFEIRALAGTSLNGIPVISNRTLSQTIRLKEDETSLIAGLLDNEETRAITGLPGFANLPGWVMRSAITTTRTTRRNS